MHQPPATAVGAYGSEPPTTHRHPPFRTIRAPFLGSHQSLRHLRTWSSDSPQRRKTAGEGGREREANLADVCHFDLLPASDLSRTPFDFSLSPSFSPSSFSLSSSFFLPIAGFHNLPHPRESALASDHRPQVANSGRFTADPNICLRIHHLSQIFRPSHVHEVDEGSGSGRRRHSTNNIVIPALLMFFAPIPHHEQNPPRSQHELG